MMALDGQQGIVQAFACTNASTRKVNIMGVQIVVVSMHMARDSIIDANARCC